MNVIDEKTLAPHVKEDMARNEAAARAALAGRDRNNKIVAAARTLRERNLELSRHNGAIRKQVSEFQEVANADLLALAAEGDALRKAGQDLESKLSQLRRLANVIALLAMLAMGAPAWGAQDTDITQNEVRDPRKLATYLTSNAQDAETRVAALETATGSGTITPLVITNANLSAFVSNLVVRSGGTATMPEATVDGKYATVGGDASTGLMILKGTFTNRQATVTFGAVFGAAPAVVCGFTDDVSALANTNAAIGATSITASNFVPKCAIAATDITNCNFIAVGTRP